MPSDRAFAQPPVIVQRLGREDLDARRIARYDLADLTALFTARPAVHDSPALMARCLQELCRHLVARHDGRAVRPIGGLIGFSMRAALAGTV